MPTSQESPPACKASWEKVLNALSSVAYTENQRNFRSPKCPEVVRSCRSAERGCKPDLRNRVENTQRRRERTSRGNKSAATSPNLACLTRSQGEVREAHAMAAAGKVQAHISENFAQFWVNPGITHAEYACHIFLPEVRVLAIPQPAGRPLRSLRSSCRWQANHPGLLDR